MTLIYASCALSQRRFSEAFPSADLMPGQQVQKYHRLMLSGFAANSIRVVAITAAPITRRNWDRLLCRFAPDFEDGVEYEFLPLLNVPILKNAIAAIGSFMRTCRIMRRDREAMVVCDVLNLSVAVGALLAAKVFHRPSVGIVTDLPKFLNRKIGRARLRLFEGVMGQFSHYVLLTEQMSSIVKRPGVKYVVIEGQVDARMEQTVNSMAGKSPTIVCLYAGAVDKRYGIQSLVDGFLRADVPNSELHIYGRGDYVDQLRQISLINPTVRYCGVRPNSVVVTEELSATLLVNPRPTTQEFVRFSFPSKNMEYMVSGTPVLTTRLPGMPDEYLPYVYVIDDESANGIARALREVLHLPREELHERGLAAKQFVLDHKSNVAQAARILRMVSV